ncbi:MAG: DegV family protein [Clostridia bacterium]|nr:DegV family protein [Clostridia bacterium]
MSYKIVMDSAAEVNPRLVGKVVSVPLTVSISGKDYIADENMDIDTFRAEVRASKEPPRSSCPSPDAFCNAIGECDRVYIVAITSVLSGSYNSARLGLQMYLEENPGKKGYAFDSLNASGGEALVAEKIIELEEKGLEFEEIVKQVEEYIPTITTNVVLEDLSVLYKNGRLSKVAYVATSLIDLVAVLGLRNGELVKIAQARGVKRALKTLAETSIADIKAKGIKKITITHSAAPERAEALKATLEKEIEADIVIVPTGGLISMYAGEKGLVISY